MPGSHKLAILAEEGGIVDGKEHTHRRLVHGDGLQGLRILEICNGVANLEAFDADYCTYIAAIHFIHIGLAQALEHHQLLDFLLLDHIIALAQTHLRAGLEGPAGNLAHGYPAHIGGEFQRRNEKLGRALDHLRSRYDFEYSIEQRSDVSAGLFPVQRHPALLCRAINGSEIELVVRGVEIAHQIENFFLNLVGTAVGLIDLVDYDHGLLPHLKGFLKHETGLGHTAFKGVHKQQNTVRHIQHPLHFASEIAMARSIYNIDFDSFVCY